MFYSKLLVCPYYKLHYILHYFTFLGKKVQMALQKYAVTIC